MNGNRRRGQGVHGIVIGAWYPQLVFQAPGNPGPALGQRELVGRSFDGKVESGVVDELGTWCGAEVRRGGTPDSEARGSARERRRTGAQEDHSHMRESRTRDSTFLISREACGTAVKICRKMWSRSALTGRAADLVAGDLRSKVDCYGVISLRPRPFS